MTDQLLRGSEVCRLLGGIKRETLWRWRRRYGFPAPIRVNSNLNLWRREDVESWLEKRRGEAA